MSNELGNTPADKNYKPSGISKAEEMANKRWPIHPWSILPKEGEHGEIINFDEWLEDFRLGVQSFSLNAGYKEGYEQAEKDLGWISVKDRLPDTTEYVFTCVKMNGIPQCVGFHFYKDGKWWEGYEEDTVGAVEYWMQIPKFKETKK